MVLFIIMVKVFDLFYYNQGTLTSTIFKQTEIHISDKLLRIL